LYLCGTIAMDRATFESQKPFAGEKKPSMQRRCVDNDYTARRMYMITMVTEERRPLFGKVVGQSDAVEPSPEVPRVALSPLGEAVAEIWQTIGCHHREVKVVALQMMPDHLHAILFVKERMEKPLGKVLLGVKQACNRAFREVMPVEFVAVAQQHAISVMLTAVSSAHSRKAHWSMVVTDDGMLILMSEEHPSKAPKPIVVNPSGKVAERSSLQPIKAYLAISVTL